MSKKLKRIGPSTLYKYNTKKAKDMRKHYKFNSDGTVSTHRMSNYKGIAHPTVFPVKGGWKEASGFSGFEEAIKRNEVLYFNTPEEAKQFAEGGYKSTRYKYLKNMAKKK